MAKVKMAGSYKAQGKIQVKQGIKRIRIYRAPRQAMAVSPKPGKEPAMKNGTSALDIAKNNWIKSLQKEHKIKLSVMEAQAPRRHEHSEEATGPRPRRHRQGHEQERGEGEAIHNKMLMATTRQLSASTGAQYSRYTVETNYVH
jgi:hypothetical protein